MMTEKDIRKLLSDINKDKVDGQIITRPLSDTVDYAKVWPENIFSASKPPEGEWAPLTAYFIHEKKEQYIAVIIVTESLKYYALPQYRKSNVFLNPFRDIIIPHILQHKPVQRIVLNHMEYSEKEYASVKKTALAIGFKITRENERKIRMVIEAASLGKREYIAGKNTGISERRKQEIKAEISVFLQKLEFFETEVELKTGDFEYMEDIREIMDALERVSVNLANLV